MTETRRALAGVVGAISVVAIYLWDDALLAAPIIAADQMFGMVPAFLFFSLLYTFGSLVVALWVVRVYDRESSPDGNAVSRWVERQGQRRRGTWGARLLQAGTMVAFVASSFIVGGILTTWFIRLGGRREGIERLALLSCLIFGVTFTAWYTLLSQGASRL